MYTTGSPSWNTTTYTTTTVFYEHHIHTTVTKDPKTVDAWIMETETNHQPNQRLVVGLDTEWRPSFSKGVEKRVAVLQLCVGHTCLVFQVIHSPYIPCSLYNFLNNPNNTFFGVNILEDVSKIVRYYRIGSVADRRILGAKVVELGLLATQVYGQPMAGLGLKGLTEVVLGKEVEKRMINARTSSWDSNCLSVEQVSYASVDGFLCFEIARVLSSMAGFMV